MFLFKVDCFLSQALSPVTIQTTNYLALFIPLSSWNYLAGCINQKYSKNLSLTFTSLHLIPTFFNGISFFTHILGFFFHRIFLFTTLKCKTTLIVKLSYYNYFTFLGNEDESDWTR